jgi:PAS domain-containing protein
MYLNDKAMNYEEHDFTNAQMLRAKAEEQLKLKEKMDSHDKETDTKKLLHELQVHQIELEMQNEELLKAYETAEEALKKYTMLYDLAPMGYFTLDKDGTISELNFTAASLLDDKRISLINSNFKLYIAESSKGDFANFFSKVLKYNTKESCEVQLGYNDKDLGTVYMEGILSPDDEKCLISVIDIARFKK